MSGVTERVRAVRERIAQRRAGGASEADRDQSKVVRAQKRAQADARRREHNLKYSGGGGDGGGGAG